jgi:tetratricopeptide (TPR) repeat protein
MNKERNKIIFTLVAIALLIGAFIFFKQRQSTEPQAVENQEEVIKENPEVSNQEPKTETKDQAILASFNKKMKEASALFLKKDYQGAIDLYNQALSIEKSEYAYAGLYSAELATKDYISAEKAILSAIEQNSASSDYWSWYLVLLQDAMGAPREKLEQVYNKALNSVLDNKKINIVTQYARVLENIGDYNGAITQWEKAITLNPSMKDIYQKEIDTLKTKI